jgi:hypothetical protein
LLLAGMAALKRTQLILPAKSFHWWLGRCGSPYGGFSATFPTGLPDATDQRWTFSQATSVLFQASATRSKTVRREIWAGSKLALTMSPNTLIATRGHDDGSDMTCQS